MCRCPDTAVVSSGGRTSSLDVQLLECPEDEAADHMSWTMFRSLDDGHPRSAAERQSTLEQTDSVERTLYTCDYIERLIR